MKNRFSQTRAAVWSLWSIMILMLLLVLSCSNDKKSSTRTKNESTAASKNLLVENLQAATANRPNSATEAMESVRTNKHYLCLLFYNSKDDLYQVMEETVTNFQDKSPEGIQIYEALVTELKEADVVKKFGINRAPLPVALIFAPNGAITGGFPQKITQEQLAKCIVPELIMNVLKSVQSNKVALVLLQNNQTKFNAEVTQAATDFASDERLNGFVDIIKQNPDNSEINDFLAQCKLDHKITDATAVLIVPPGQIGGVYSGKITKDTIIAGLAACSAGSGCCGPR